MTRMGVKEVDPDSDESARRFHCLRRPFSIAAALLICAGAWFLVRRVLLRPVDVPAELRQARRQLLLGDAGAAEELSRRILQAAPRSIDAMLIAGRAAEKQGRFREALGYYDMARRGQPPPGAGVRSEGGAAAAHAAAGRVCLYQLREPWEAEIRFRRALECDPHELTATREMVHLLSLCGRQWALIPHVLELLRQNQFDAGQLVLLAAPEGSFGFPETLPRFRQAAPNDPIVLLALAQQAEREGRRDEAERFVRQALRNSPRFLEARLLLARLLIESDRLDEFAGWVGINSPDAADHPEAWAILAQWRQKQNDAGAAARCYWEALKRNPSHAEANYQLSQVLVGLGENARAQPFLERANRLHELRDTESGMSRLDADSLPSVRRTVERLMALGRYWEAWGWCTIALRINPQAAWAVQQSSLMAEALRGDPPLTLDEFNPALEVDLSDFPLPAAATPAPAPLAKQGASGRGGDVDEGRVNVTFADVAAQRGLDFSFYNGGHPISAGLKKMYETTGGGAAVLDFDRDGWPDVYLTQGCAWPHGGGEVTDSASSDRLDGLFRNSGDAHFGDVAVPAGIAEDDFSQGAAAGDYDNDGFPDLYVANIGRNRLFHNNGDGTFDEVPVDAGEDKEWTSSCLIADLNGDALPDILAVNYLSGDDLWTRICVGPTGKPQSCAPHDFDPSQDRLYLNRGDGTFEDITMAAGIAVPGGKGLGVLAADVDGSGRLSLFITVDAQANLFFSNETESAQSIPELVERGLPAGLALNRAGKYEAGMGIAAGDANQDGRLDFFTTNFWNETNTLYLHQGVSTFRDATREFHLEEAGLKMLGWGTQFLDGELDGYPDLITTNGHIDDHRESGQGYQMPAQYFRNTGRSRFVAAEQPLPGPYFSRPRLGRGLARLDFDRDGLEDVVISHLDAPAALLRNTTSPHGHFLMVRLAGTDSARDAIGTTVTVVAAGRSFVRQLVAGDGYHASNQKALLFGLAQSTGADEIRLRWPTGRVQTFRRLPVDAEILFIEGSSTPVRLD